MSIGLDTIYFCISLAFFTAALIFEFSSNLIRKKETDLKSVPVVGDSSKDPMKRVHIFHRLTLVFDTIALLFLVIGAITSLL